MTLIRAPLSVSRDGGSPVRVSQVTLFEVINTLFTAVTFHELFKEAALDGNDKLEFGIQWQEVPDVWSNRPAAPRRGTAL